MSVTIQNPRVTTTNDMCFLSASKCSMISIRASLMAEPRGSVSKESSAMQRTLVRSLGQEDPLEEGMTTPSSILVW